MCICRHLYWIADKRRKLKWKNECFCMILMAMYLSGLCHTIRQKEDYNVFCIDMSSVTLILISENVIRLESMTQLRTTLYYLVQYMVPTTLFWRIIFSIWFAHDIIEMYWVSVSVIKSLDARTVSCFIVTDTNVINTVKHITDYFNFCHNIHVYMFALYIYRQSIRHSPVSIQSRR